MLRFEHVTLRRGPRVLFADADFALHAGWKIGVTGANGTGKSSLFALVRGELHADLGDFSMPPGWVLAHVAQETPAVDTSAIDYVLDGDAELRAIEAALAQPEHDGHKVAELHARLEAIDGYGARARAARLMHGLGFRADQEMLPVRAFSGGWRMRLNLARALMCRSDLLLLDEPTNHLDLDAVLWLEEWLRTYRGTLLLISHDRDFLDGLVDHVVHIENEVVELSTGNFSDFEIRRAERRAQQQAAFERQQREVVRVQSFIDRFKAKATKARQAQSRMKALERMERLAPVQAESPFHFSFRTPEKLPHPLLTLDRVAIGYGTTPLLAGIGAVLEPGARIGLLGVNGAGKSTFVKLLAGALAPLHGRCESAVELKVGYFAQHQLEQLDPAASPLLHLRRADPKALEQSLRDFLGSFGFVGERALEPVAPFSGGEKARLALALVVYQRPNLLLLDEPTNHLDLRMRDALTMALQDYEGALVLVSHDRYLLRSVTDEFWLVGDGTVKPFDGDLDDYRTWLSRRANDAGAVDAASGENSAAARRDRKREEAEKRQRLAPLRREMEKAEAQMAALEKDKLSVEAELADPVVYADKDKLKQLLTRQTDIARRLAAAEEAWLEIGEQLEAG